MARYLIVAHQTAASRTLIERAQTLAAEDRGATFTLLIPATHATDVMRSEPDSRFTWEEHAVWERAHAKATEARAEFEQAGLRLDAASIGDASPVLAVEDELRMRPGHYDAILLSTLPPARSRWLEDDVDGRLKRLGLPVIHVSGNANPIRRPGATLRQMLSRAIPARVRTLGQRIAASDGAPELALIGMLMGIYVIGSTVLALTVNRTFFMNDLMAIAVFGGLMAWLVVSMRRPAR
jgi:hypothetical protein